MVAIFTRLLIAIDETLATQHSHIEVSRKISPDVENIRQAFQIKTKTCAYIRCPSKWRRLLRRPGSKMTQILSIPFAKRSQLSHKERSTAKACNEILKVLDIERWNQRSKVL